MKIAALEALEILDSRGNPTVAATVILEDGKKATAMVPSGASTGSHEAYELRDQDPSRYQGKGVLQTIKNIEEIIAPSLVGEEVWDQNKLDQKMIDLDGTPNKSNLGANAILAVSMAICRASAHHEEIPLYAYIAGLFGKKPDKYILPIPMMNLLNGGKHALGASDFQEYMLFPYGAKTFAQALQMGAETFHHLGTILEQAGFQTTVGDEGGYAPALGGNTPPLDAMMEAIVETGYIAGKDIAITLDPAASEFFDNQNMTYFLQTENRVLNSIEIVNYYQELISKYPIVSIEDGLAEDDWGGFVFMTKEMGNKMQIVGDDLFVTNSQRLQEGIEKKAGNSILIKLNQIGTVSETVAVIKLATAHNYSAIISHRSGETEDTFIADFAVGAGVGQIKTGSLSRSERISKYNRLLQIEKELGEKAQVAKWWK